MTDEGIMKEAKSIYTLEGEPCALKVSTDSEAVLLIAMQTRERGDIPDNATVRIMATCVFPEDDLGLLGHILEDDDSQSSFTLGELIEEIEASGLDPEDYDVLVNCKCEYSTGRDFVQIEFPLANVPLPYLSDCQENDFNPIDDDESLPESELLPIERIHLSPLVEELSEIFCEEKGNIYVKFGDKNVVDVPNQQTNLSAADEEEIETFGN